jgi:two-component sensor histidine kinase
LTQKNPSFSIRFFGYVGRRSVRSLLLLVLAITLIPVFLISFGQAYARLSLDREVVRQNLINNVALSAEQALHVIDSAEQSLVSLADRDEVRGATGDCAGTLAIAQLAMPYTTNLARINPEGIITCSARPIVMKPDISNRSWLASLSSKEEVSFAGPTVEVTSGRPVLIVGLGLKESDGTALGLIVVGIDLEKLEQELQKRERNRDARLTIVDRNGVAIHRQLVPLPHLTGQQVKIDPSKTLPGTIRMARDNQGKPWTYALATLVSERLSVVISMPDEILYASTFRHVATDVALPLIALILGGAGLWFAAQIWAIKPIENLQALARQYSVGNFEAAPPNLQYGPVEMRELRDELLSMAVRSVHRDGRLKRIANQKDDLVKELHHRVKNNLQIVISLISLQVRQLSDPAQKAPLERVHARIMAMALVERLIVETDDNPTIDVRMLLDEICGLVRRIYQSDSLRIKLNLESESVQIQTDKATALALFTFEAITNAFRHGFSDKAEGMIYVRFVTDDANVAALEIHDTGTGWTELDKETGTGHRLLQAFTRQLGGQFDLSTSAKEGSKAVLTFTIRAAPQDVGVTET